MLKTCEAKEDRAALRAAAYDMPVLFPSKIVPVNQQLVRYRHPARICLAAATASASVCICFSHPTTQCLAASSGVASQRGCPRGHAMPQAVVAWYRLGMDTLRRIAYRSRQKPRIYHAWLLMCLPNVTHVRTGEKELVHGSAGKQSGAVRGPPCSSGYSRQGSCEYTSWRARSAISYEAYEAHLPVPGPGLSYEAYEAHVPARPL